MAAENSHTFEVISVFGGSADEAVVTGYVRSGSIRTGELASFTTDDGVPMIAPITRISTGGAELKVVREGQQTNLNLSVEPNLIRIGAVLSTPNDTDAFAPTMVASEVSQSTFSEAPSDVPQEVVEIGLLINRELFDEAHSKLLEHASSDGKNPVEVDRLFARISLEAKGDLHDPAKGLEYITRAYANGGGENADVIETLAYAHGANANPRQGVRFLEQLFFHSRDLKARNYYERRIDGFRVKHALPDQWQVIDPLGEVVFTADSIDDLEKGAKAKAFPEGAKCRKNRIGKLVTVPEAIKLERVGPGADGANTKLLLNTGIGAFAGMIAGIVIGAATGLSPLSLLLVLGTGGGVAGFTVGRVQFRA